MSDKQKGVKEPRSRNSKRRNVSGDRSRRRTVSEKSGSLHRPKLELLPSSIMSTACGRISVPNLNAIARGHKTKPPAEHQRFFTKQLGLNDCYHFLHGNCKKGKDCTYRHQESARTATIVCKFWLKNECTNLTCSYLHAKTLPLSHDKIPCHFEQREGGCQKADCDYQHELPRRSNSGVVSEHVTAALKNLRVSQKSESESYTKCGHCGVDLRGSLALKTGSLMSCLGCADMMQQQ